ncbi:hypothetical protein [Brevibacillus brevis]|uniref:hypothetical protein n=1 Tax=Brevibacillus brevis TaxID=1393 RepID=UPI0037C9FB91
MALLNKPLKLLEVIWSGHFDIIFIYVDGTWSINEKKKEEVCSLCKEELIESSELSVLNQLMILNTKLLEATTEEYANKAKIAFETRLELWKEVESMSKEFAEVKGEIYCEAPFEYSPFPTIEERFAEYYGQYLLDYVIDIQQQLTIEYDSNFDFSIYAEGDESYGFGSAENYNIDMPFDSKISFFISDANCRPVYFIGENHSLFQQIKFEVIKVAKLAINDAHNSVSEDLHEWFKSQFGYELK